MSREPWFYSRRHRVRALLTRLLLRPPEPCYGARWDYHLPVAIGWNLYRCVDCAARRQPERLYHRLTYRATRGKIDLFGHGVGGPF